MLLPGLVYEFSTAAKIIRQLGLTGQTYRRQVMLDDIRLEQGRQSFKGFIDTWDQANPFPDDIVPDVFMREGMRYKASGWATLYDPQTGNETDQWMSVFSDYNGTAEFYKDEIQGQYNKKEQYSDEERWIVKEFEIQTLLHNRRMANQAGSY